MATRSTPEGLVQCGPVSFEWDGSHIEVRPTKGRPTPRDPDHGPRDRVSLTGTLAQLALRQAVDECPVVVVLHLARQLEQGRSAA